MLPGVIQAFLFGSAIFFFFRALEGTVSPAAKRALSVLLKDVEVHPIQGWTSNLSDIMDSVFSLDDWRAVRFPMASLLSVGFMCIVWYAIHPADMLFTIRNFDQDRIGVLVMLVLLINMPADILAYCKTYGIITGIRPTTVVRSMAWLLIDIVSTIGIFAVLAFYVTLSLQGRDPDARLIMEHRDEYEFALSFILTAFSTDGLTLRSGVVQSGVPPPGILLYSTFFATAWMLLHCISVIVVRLMLFIGKGVSWVKWVLDIDNHPLQSLGLVAGAVVGICWWVGSMLHSLFA